MANSKTDLDRLQGTWTILTVEMDGMAMPAGASGGSKIVVKGDRFTTISMGATYNGIVTLDSAKRPKTFDLKFTAGPEKGNTSVGIYELNGDDWKICLTVTGNTRPTGFATKPGSGHAFETLRREIGAAAAPLPPGPADVRFDPVAELQGEWSLISLTLNGQPLGAEYIKYGKRVVKGDEMTLKFGRDLITKARMAADPTRHPKTMDYIHLAGAMAGQSQQGIYEFDGRSLTVCSSPPGQLRPSDFTATVENGRTLAVWRK